MKVVFASISDYPGMAFAVKLHDAVGAVMQSGRIPELCQWALFEVAKNRLDKSPMTDYRNVFFSGLRDYLLNRVNAPLLKLSKRFGSGH